MAEYMGMEVIQEICLLLGKNLNEVLDGLCRVFIRSKSEPATIAGCYGKKFKQAYPHESEDIILSLQEHTFSCRWWVVSYYLEDKLFSMQGFEDYPDADLHQSLRREVGVDNTFIIDMGDYMKNEDD